MKAALISVVRAEPTLLAGLVVALNAVWVLIFPEEIAAIIVGVEGAIMSIFLRALVMANGAATLAITDAATAGAATAVASLTHDTIGEVGEVLPEAIETVEAAAGTAAQVVLQDVGLIKKVALHG